MIPPSIRSDFFLRGFLALTILASGWAFLPGKIDGQIAFVLYRAPKLAAMVLLVWWFLALFLFLQRRRLDRLDLWAAMCNPQVALLALLLLIFAASTLWARVPANALLELSLYLPLFMLVVLLVVWIRSDARVRTTIELSLIVFAAVATLLGAFQLAFEPRWLTAINPRNEVGNPSVMGYKNPMALAIAGQIFLLCRRIATSRHPWRWLLIGCALAELAYLGQLESRTSLAAVAIGTLALMVTAAAWPPKGLSLRHLATATSIAGILLALGITVVPAARQKAVSLLSYAVQPQVYLDSDRGIYLRNTLNMVHHRPWGVGVGDWQTHYPVYRLHNRFRSFEETHEVRRAHSDHVQILGENGWLGLAVWFAFLGAIVLGLTRSYRASRNPRDLFLLGQIVFWVAAMATDYVLDLPFHRLAFFLLVACAIASQSRPENLDGAPRFPIGARNLCVGVTIGAAILSSMVAISTLHLAHDGAAMTRLYLQALDNKGRERARLLQRAAAHGGTLLGTTVHSKTRYKDWQVLADVFLRLGAKDAARRCAVRALELQPHSPKTFLLLAKLHSGEARQRWREGYRYILYEAVSGYRRPYPEISP